MSALICLASSVMFLMVLKSTNKNGDGYGAVLITAFVQVLSMIMAVSSNQALTPDSTPNPEEGYKFASQSLSIISIRASKFDSDLYPDYCQNEESNVLLDEAKQILYNSSVKDNYPNLAWDNLDTISINVFTDNHDFTVKAEYFGEINSIFVDPYFLYDDDDPYYLLHDDTERLYILVHELMHALLEPGYETTLEEGIADFYTLIIAKENGVDYDVRYPVEFSFWAMLSNIWGTDNCLDMFMDNTLEKNIDDLTLAGYGKKFTTILYLLTYPEKKEEYFDGTYDDLCKMAMDIVVHATANYAKNIGDDEERNQMLYICREFLVVEEEYFLEILS